MTRTRGGRMLRSCFAVVLAAFSALVLCAPDTAVAQPIATLRVMLHPAAAPRGTLPDGVRAHLASLAGASVTLVGTTRTGALELAVSGARDPADLRDAVK